MSFSAHLKNMLQRSAGFTMIELLVVITILGILAVAVLSAINPIEQINRGRDTASRSDAEQLISAIERFNAFQGYYPWQIDANDVAAAAVLQELVGAVNDSTWVVNGDVGTNGCTVMMRLSSGDPAIAGCVAAQELRDSFIDRVSFAAGSRRLYVYNRGTQGDSTYVCFVPQSGAFITEASDRCNAGLPVDLAPMEDEICNPVDGAGRTVIQEGEAPVICLP